jgi:soluble lytic murein transglycosylase-like protein
MAKLSQSELGRYAGIAGPQYGVPSNLLVAVALHESGGDPTVRGRSGEYGLMQLMPGTADMLGFKGDYSLLLREPLLNMRLGAKYLSQQFKKYGTWPLALSAYNAGHPVASNVATYVAPILQRAGGLTGAGMGVGLLVLAAGLLVATRRR